MLFPLEPRLQTYLIYVLVEIIPLVRQLCVFLAFEAICYSCKMRVHDQPKLTLHYI
jgi:hypothetical protein